MAKPKQWRITMLVTVEEIGPEPHETRPIVEELQTRPATWYPPDDERRRRTRKEEHIRVKGHDDGSDT